eukprot:509508_1
MASEVSDHSENDEKNTTPRATERTEMVGKAQKSTSSAGAPHDAVLTGIQKGFDPIEGLIQTMFQRRSDSDDKSDTEAAFCYSCDYCPNHAHIATLFASLWCAWFAD